MDRDQFLLDISHELLIDNFAGGGGASTGIEQATGRSVDIAINHDPETVAMHAANHPQTHHYCEDVYHVDPRTATQGRPVGLVWLSPDCKHHSKAKGGKPREKKIRGLAWVGVKWAGQTRARVLMLENVEEFQDWGPLVAKRDVATGRVLTIDGRVAAVGERIPIEQQHLVPDPRRRGQHFRQFVAALRQLGYAVEWRELRACDYGAPTTRKRLFLIARCDSHPIVWPAPTHGDPKAIGFKRRQLKPWRTAGECIDWSIHCPSIFERDRPLADATLRRIARGIVRYVLQTGEPYIVKSSQNSTGHGLGEPLHTAMAGATRFGLVEPFLTEHALACAMLIKHYGGNYTGHGSDLAEPIHTITASDHHSLVTSHLLKLRHHIDGQPVTEPIDVIAAGGQHFGEVRAFLVKYYGNERDGVSLFSPMHTLPTRDRMGLVTVQINGEPYSIADIGMRMLEPHELYAAQGFPRWYRHALTIDGRRLPKYAQVRMCGNSVSPVMPKALVRANLPELTMIGRKQREELAA